MKEGKGGRDKRVRVDIRTETEGEPLRQCVGEEDSIVRDVSTGTAVPQRQTDRLS